MAWNVPAGIRFNDSLFSEPLPLACGRPPVCGGIVAFLARNPAWAPKPLQPLYFEDFGNEGVRNLALPRGAEGLDLRVSFLPMPYSTAAQRRALCRELIAAYNPALQRNAIGASAAELSQRVEELEARQQEQNQNVTSLLAQLARLFSPQPVLPKRSIGFLADWSSAAAGSTQTGSSR